MKKKNKFKPNPKNLTYSERNRQMKDVFGGTLAYLCRGCGKVIDISSVTVEICKAEGKYVECRECLKPMFRVARKP